MIDFDLRLSALLQACKDLFRVHATAPLMRLKQVYSRAGKLREKWEKRRIKTRKAVMFRSLRDELTILGVSWDRTTHPSQAYIPDLGPAILLIVERDSHK
jgi:hypothetical protein